MKRIIVLLLLTSYLFSGMAIAEEITLPNGLQFGMTISEAIAVSGYPKSKLHGSDMAYYIAYGVPFLDDCIEQNVVIGGMNAEMQVLFDDNGLRQIKYQFLREEVDKIKANIPGESIASSHQAVEISLKQKYGESLEPSKNSHLYMPPINKYVSWNYSADIFGMKTTSFYEATALIPTLRIVKMEDGSSVYIDNYVDAMTNGVQFHELTYTYYNFAIDNNTQSSSVDF